MSNYDEALERFHLVDFEYAGGLANHGPMAVQALVDLGHPALIPAFVDRYVPRVPVAPRGRVLSESEQLAARGDPARVHDWVATFEARLEREAPTGLVGEVVPPLLPGLFAAAGHGLLRTVHALRGLEAEDNAIRRRELARGLAYWVTNLQPLSSPGDPALRAAVAGEAGAFEASLAQAFDRLAGPSVRPTPDEPFTLAVRRLEPADSAARLPAVAADALLAALVRVAARLYRANPEARIAFAHAVTIPAALRWLLPRLPASAAAAASEGVGQALSAVAAFQALYGVPGRLAQGEAGAIDAEVEATARSWDEIRYRAACSIEEHAIKLACACLLEERAGAHPVLAKVAADAALRIDGTRGAC